MFKKLLINPTTRGLLQRRLLFNIKRTYAYYQMDGNEACSTIAYKLNQSFFIYPITPSSDMAEKIKQKSVEGAKNIFGQVPLVEQLQSEAGVIGAIEGALMSGGLTTTFTSSQGLLLMIPTLYQLSACLLPGVIHVASRSVAGSGTSIGGDHTDVLGCRSTGVGMLSSGSTQEAHDMALAAHIISLRSKLPFIHFLKECKFLLKLIQLKLLMMIKLN